MCRKSPNVNKILTGYMHQRQLICDQMTSEYYEDSFSNPWSDTNEIVA